ncbi:DUF998 domain-containing protein [Plantactinospora sp. GCM10030261]|uniref:DUF998 domain-containing protein n=1 Tax=Plantactinospora sp. GCM10030261 TaxID=3273420 RepID=UPI00360F1A31
MTDVGSVAGAAGRFGRYVGLAVATLALVLFALLHVLVGWLSPVTDTISDYALSTSGWMFNAAVLALAAASLFLLGPLLRIQARVASGPSSAGAAASGPSPAGPAVSSWASSLGAACFAAWCVGLVVLTVFPRDPVGAPITVTGEIHKWASVVALLSLPVGALLVAVRHRSRGARVVAVVAAVCLVALVPFVSAYLADSPLRPFLGLLERGVALGEVVLLILLGTIRLRRVAARTTDQRQGPPT